METKQDKAPESFKISGDWEVQSKKLKAKFSQLTDSDLKFETGKEEELLTRVATKLGKKREDVISIIQQAQPVKA